ESGINIDKTAPVVTASRDHAANANNWYKDNVVVSFAATDSLSGVAATAGPVTLSAEAAGQSASGSATDLAGNVGSVTESNINIDKTAPVVTASRDHAANANNWYKDNVVVSFAAIDSLSGVATTAGPVTLAAEAAGQSASGSATDLAGNVGSVTESNINIDKTAPVVTASRDHAANANNWYKDNVVVSFAATDSLSGVFSTAGPVTLAAEAAGQ